MPHEIEAQATKLLLLTLALEQADESELTALLAERAEVISFMEGEAPFSTRVGEILAKVELAEKRARRALEGRKTLLATSLEISKQGQAIPAKYRADSAFDTRRVA